MENVPAGFRSFWKQAFLAALSRTDVGAAERNADLAVECLRRRLGHAEDPYRSDPIQTDPKVASERSRIVALAKRAFAHDTNPWAPSYRPNWPEIMTASRNHVCEEYVLALHPATILRLLGEDPYK